MERRPPSSSSPRSMIDCCSHKQQRAALYLTYLRNSGPGWEEGEAEREGGVDTSEGCSHESDVELAAIFCLILRLGRSHKDSYVVNNLS